ncbi:MAG: PD-(D/E)XK nuclease family protein, partial [Spirochaetales bacterium]|nr:PD-(D/E)XK nuclease family protein [Spirochaetales bacterium]
MKYVEEIIISNFSNKNSFYVFPSELVATFWMRKSLELGKTAILSRRFLSWDKFKEKTFSLNMDYSPVNAHIRTLFASSLLEENKKNGNLLRGLIRPEHSAGSPAFLSRLTSILTDVKSFRENSDLKNIPLDPGIREDLDFLYDAYTRFLVEREMFEPSWVKPEITDIGEDYFLFFPEVIEDYEEFSADLEKSAVVNIILTDTEELKKVEHFASSPLELKSLLGKIGSLLDSGVRSQDIAITLPDMDGWRVNLESEAGLRSIPLDFRQGKSLTEYPGARIFKDLLSCERSGFSLPSMKQILLNSSIPWKEKETAAALFKFGVKHHCFKNYRLKGREIDIWKDSLIKSEESRLIEFYQDLKSAIIKIADGKTFGDIKIAVQLFISIFLDTKLWPLEILKEFQICLDTLNDLDDASIKAGDLKYGSSCNLWLSAIEERIYVKRSVTVGVNVFPYRVAGGASFKWHFIPGLSQTSVSVIKSKYQFLKENQRDNIPGLDLDFTESFINLYNLSGENIFFSYSSNSFSGPALPPSSFVLKRVVSDIIDNLSTLNDEYVSELAYWAGENILPGRIFPLMKNGIDFTLASAFVSKKNDYTKQGINQYKIKNNILDVLLDKDRYLSVSPSSLDQFLACPYYFLFNRGFRVNEDEYKEEYIDHRVFGQVIHECFDRFFKYVSESGSEFSKSHIEEYKTEISSIIDKVFNRYLVKGESFIPPVWNYCRDFTHDKLTAFIDIEAVQFPGFRLASSEKKYSYKWEDKKIELTGRIDRVSFKGDKTAIIDYKKNNRLKRGDMVSAESDPSTFQIPFYIYLVEKNGLKVSSASYYNVTDSRYNYVHNLEPVLKKDKPWCSEEEISSLIYKMEESISSMDKRIRSG